MLLFARSGNGIARVAGRSVMLMALLGLGACANLTTAYRTRTHSNKAVTTISMDAKQRNVFLVPEWENDNVNKVRVCAEASPDVFSALAASGGVLVNVDAKAQAGSGQVGFSIAEAAASIERTQTVNLLRESFYRTCERYLSGAIKKETFVVQAGRDARAMVAVLAIEQLTGAIRRPSTIISGPATSVQLQAANNALTLLGPAQQRAREANQAVIDKQKELETGCDAKKDGEGKPISDADKKICKDDAKKSVLALQAERDRADAEVKQIIAVSGSVLPQAVDLSTSPGINNSVGPADKPDYTAITAIAERVENIVREVTQQDDMRLFCIEKYADPTLNEVVRNACVGLIAASAGAERSALMKSYFEVTSEDVSRDITARKEYREKLKIILANSSEARYEYIKKILPECAKIDRKGCEIFVDSLVFSAGDLTEFFKVLEKIP